MKSPPTKAPILTTAQGPVTWLERLATDPSLKAFVEAEIARAKIELDTLRYNVAHWRQVAERLGFELEALKAKKK